MVRYTVQNADNKQSQYHGKTAVIVADSYPELTKKAEKMGWGNWLVIKTENACDTVKAYGGERYTCGAVYNCCDCGGNGCCCGGCFSCNACEHCKNDN